MTDFARELAIQIGAATLLDEDAALLGDSPAALTPERARELAAQAYDDPDHDATAETT